MVITNKYKQATTTIEINVCVREERESFSYSVSVQVLNKAKHSKYNQVHAKVQEYDQESELLQ